MEVIFVPVWSLPDNNLVRHSWDVEVNLTERLTTSEHQLSATAVERDTLHSNLSKQGIELERLRAAARQRECGCSHWILPTGAHSSHCCTLLSVATPGVAQFRVGEAPDR